MVEKRVNSLFPIVKNYTGKYFFQILCLIVLSIVVITTFSLQSKVIGLEKGYNDLQPKHHGWVTAHTLAIISKATPENFFVGYAMAYKDNQNNIRYNYFDRYPVFFSAIFNLILSLGKSLAEKMHLAKQVMNLIFLGTLIIAFLILDKLINNKPLSLTVVLLSFSNPFLLWYKDMVHFDQPALLGFLLLIYSLALYKMDGLKKPLYISTFVAIGLGRGYASYSILILWLALEAFMILKTRGADLKEKIKSIIKHPSFYLLIIAITWGGSLLTYNIIIEAHKSDISILQTSIIQSARKRLSFNAEFNQENEGSINWPVFTAGQVSRIIQWSFPVKGMNLDILGDTILLGFMFVIMGITIWRQTLEKRMIYLILILSGFVWLIPLRNLAAFHDYTTMYYIGIPLVFYISIFAIFKPSKKVSSLLLIAGLILYISAIVQVKHLHEDNAGNADVYVYDFDRILEKIDGTGNNVRVVGVVPVGPFPLGFYLSEQYLSAKNTADYVISGNRNYLPNNLTPDNELIFLFKK